MFIPFYFFYVFLFCFAFIMPLLRVTYKKDFYWLLSENICLVSNKEKNSYLGYYICSFFTTFRFIHSQFYFSLHSGISVIFTYWTIEPNWIVSVNCCAFYTILLRSTSPQRGEGVSRYLLTWGGRPRVRSFIHRRTCRGDYLPYSSSYGIKTSYF